MREIRHERVNFGRSLRPVPPLFAISFPQKVLCREQKGNKELIRSLDPSEHIMSRKLSSHRRILSLLRSTPKTTSSFAAAATTSISSSYSSPSPSPAAFRSPVTFFPHHFSTVSGILSHFSLLPTLV